MEVKVEKGQEAYLELFIKHWGLLSEGGAAPKAKPAVSDSKSQGTPAAAASETQAAPSPTTTTTAAVDGDGAEGVPMEVVEGEAQVAAPAPPPSLLPAIEQLEDVLLREEAELVEQEVETLQAADRFRSQQAFIDQRFRPEDKIVSMNIRGQLRATSSRVLCHFPGSIFTPIFGADPQALYSKPRPPLPDLNPVTPGALNHIAPNPKPDATRSLAMTCRQRNLDRPALGPRCGQQLRPRRASPRLRPGRWLQMAATGVPGGLIK